MMLVRDNVKRRDGCEERITMAKSHFILRILIELNEAVVGEANILLPFKSEGTNVVSDTAVQLVSEKVILLIHCIHIIVAKNLML